VTVNSTVSSPLITGGTGVKMHVYLSVYSAIRKQNTMMINTILTLLEIHIIFEKYIKNSFVFRNV
jgi:hypothetical protein